MATLFDTPWASRQEFMDRLGAGLGGDYRTYSAAKRSRGVAGDFTIGDLTPYTYQTQVSGGDNGMQTADITGYKSATLDKMFGEGGWSYDPQSGMFRTRTMADPTSSTGHPGAWNGTLDPATGRLTGLQWINEDLSRGLIGNTWDKIGAAVTSPVGGPLAVLAAPYLLGAGLGGAGAPAAAAPGSGGYFGGLSAGAGGQTGLTLGAGATGLTAPAGFTLAPELGAGLAGAGAGTVALTPPGGEGYFGGLNPGASGQGLQMPGAPAAPGMGGGQGLVPAQAAVAPQSSLVTAAAPISASQASYAASPVKMALDAAKPYASLVGPGISLLGALQAPRAPQDLGPARVPGVEAPPEARGLDRQAARSPILDVLNRNRRANRNRTQLTGPGGVNLESVKVGRNTLLGL